MDGLPEAGFCGGASVLTAVLLSSTKTNKKYKNNMHHIHRSGIYAISKHSILERC